MSQVSGIVFKDDKLEAKKRKRFLSEIKFVTELCNYNLREMSFLLDARVNYAKPYLATQRKFLMKT